MVKRGEASLRTQLEVAQMRFSSEPRVLQIATTYDVPNKVWQSTCDDGSLAVSWDFLAGPAGYDPTRNLSFEEWPGIQPGEVLAAFIRLHNAFSDSSRIVEFAQLYGVLYVCEHQSNWPRTLPGWLYGGDCGECGSVISTLKKVPNEPIEAWLAYADQLRTLLKVEAQLHSEYTFDRKTLEFDLRVLRDGRTLAQSEGHEDIPPSVARRMAKRDSLPTWIHSDDFLRAQASHEVENLARNWAENAIKTGAIEVTTDREPDSGRIDFILRATALSGVVARDLLAALSSHSGTHVCDGCGTPFNPTRKPAPGRNKYCKVCQDDGNYLTARREYARKSYRKKHPEVRRRSRSDVESVAGQTKDDASPAT